MQADRGRLGARERRHVELDAFGLVEAVGMNGVEQPAHRAEFENADLNFVRRVRGRRAGDDRHCADQES